MRSHYHTVIIGGGIGGLSCAFYLARAGKHVLVIEKNAQTMGSAWAKTVNGYTFEECIHYIASMDKHGPATKFITDINAFETLDIVKLSNLYRLVGNDFDVLLNENIEDFRKTLVTIASDEKKFISNLIDTAVHFATHLRWPAYPYRWMSGYEKLKLLWPMRGRFTSLYKYKNTTFLQGIDKWISDLTLKNIIYSILHGSDLSFLACLAIMGAAFTVNGGLPTEGTHNLFKVLEKIIIDLNGEILKQQSVSKILVKNDRAIGVALTNGNEITADSVVSTIDRMTTYTQLLANCPIIKNEMNHFSQYPIGYSFNTVCIGADIKTTLEQIGAHHVRLNLSEKPIHDRHQNEWEKILSIRFCHFVNSSAAPPGHSALVLSSISHYTDWEEFTVESDDYHTPAYEQKKKEICKTMIAKAETLIKGLSASITYCDMSTPLTIKRWTGASLGVGSGGYYATPGMISRFLSEESSIHNLYFAGQFATGRQGINGALQSGKCTASLVLGDKKLGNNYH